MGEHIQCFVPKVTLEEKIATGNRTVRKNSPQSTSNIVYKKQNETKEK